jgi:hypothetical protein
MMQTIALLALPALVASLKVFGFSRTHGPSAVTGTGLINRDVINATQRRHAFAGPARLAPVPKYMA